MFSLNMADVRGEVTMRIRREEERRWARHASLYPSAWILEEKEMEHVWPWWDHLYECPEDMKAGKKLADYVLMRRTASTPWTCQISTMKAMKESSEGWASQIRLTLLFTWTVRQ